MSDSVLNAQLPPSLDDVLDKYMDVTMKRTNCVQYGKIESYDPDTQTVEVQLQSKWKTPNGDTLDYPLLIDCPIVVLQGGGAFIDFPIVSGDFCLVFFSDVDIDNWWDSGAVTEPNTVRRHSLSDGFVLVGINHKAKGLGLDGGKIRLMFNDHDLIFDDGTDFMVRYNELETAFNQLKQDFDDFVRLTYGLHTHAFDYNAGPTPASGTTAATLNTGSPSTADITPAKIDNINVPGVGE